MEQTSEMLKMQEDAFEKWYKGEYYKKIGIYYCVETGEKICPAD